MNERIQELIKLATRVYSVGPDTDEYREAWEINSECGESIAQRVDSLLAGNQ